MPRYETAELMSAIVPRLSLRDHPPLLQGHRPQQAEEQAVEQAAGGQEGQAQASTQGAHFHAERDGSRLAQQTR